MSENQGFSFGGVPRDRLPNTVGRRTRDQQVAEDRAPLETALLRSHEDAGLSSSDIGVQQADGSDQGPSAYPRQDPISSSPSKGAMNPWGPGRPRAVPADIDTVGVRHDSTNELESVPSPSTGKWRTALKNGLAAVRDAMADSTEVVANNPDLDAATAAVSSPGPTRIHTPSGDYAGSSMTLTAPEPKADDLATGAPAEGEQEVVADPDLEDIERGPTWGQRLADSAVGRLVNIGVGTALEVGGRLDDRRDAKLEQLSAQAAAVEEDDEVVVAEIVDDDNLTTGEDMALAESTGSELELVTADKVQTDDFGRMQLEATNLWDSIVHRQRDWLPDSRFVPIVQEELEPLVKDNTELGFAYYVDPLIADASIGKALMGQAVKKAKAYFDTEADEVLEGNAGFSDRDALRMPHRLSDARNRELLQVANGAPLVGLGKVLNIAASEGLKDSATPETFGQIGVVTYWSEIDKCWIAHGNEVSAAIEEASSTVRQIAEGDEDMSAAFDVDTGEIRARTDLYYAVARADGLGHDYTSIFLVENPAGEPFIGATKPLNANTSGHEAGVVNMVTGIQIQDKLEGAAISYMNNEGHRAIVEIEGQQTEVISRAYEDLTNLNEFAAAELARGIRNPQPVHVWNPNSKPIAELES